MNNKLSPTIQCQKTRCPHHLNMILRTRQIGPSRNNNIDTYLEIWAFYHYIRPRLIHQIEYDPEDSSNIYVLNVTPRLDFLYGKYPNFNWLNELRVCTLPRLMGEDQIKWFANIEITISKIFSMQIDINEAITNINNILFLITCSLLKENISAFVYYRWKDLLMRGWLVFKNLMWAHCLYDLNCKNIYDLMNVFRKHFAKTLLIEILFLNINFDLLPSTNHPVIDLTLAETNEYISRNFELFNIPDMRLAKNIIVSTGVNINILSILCLLPDKRVRDIYNKYK